MSIVILAEKPSQAKQYASAMDSARNYKGYIEVMDSLFHGQETYITYGFGHLVSLCEPKSYSDKWASWDISTLPIMPDKFKYEVPASKKGQFNIVKKLIKQATTIIIATDCDREGENIAWSIINQAEGQQANKQYLRLWINSLEKEAIRAGFNSLQPADKFKSLYIEAQTRQKADWLLGMNASRLYTGLLRNKGVNESFSIGRVQTPTLYLIYARNQLINDFKPTPYWELEAEIQSNNQVFKGVLEPYQKFNSLENIQVFMKQYSLGESNNGYIKEVSTERKKKSAPKLYLLSQLQAKANAKYKYSAQKTLEIVQALYEKTLVTYPRTSTSYITENEAKYLISNLDNMKQLLGISHHQEVVEPGKAYVNNSKVQEHHAIILTKNIVDLSNLSSEEKNIYLLIAKATMAIFLPQYQYDETTILTNVNDLIFKSKTRNDIDLGWKILYQQEESEEEVDLPNIQVAENERVTVKPTILEKETKPPAYYTEGTLIKAMKNVGKDMEESDLKDVLKETQGIGTEATRSGIIETLKNRAYIETKKNKIIVTDKGELLCRVIEEEPLLKSAEMTAKWEEYLQKIGQGQGQQAIFLNNIAKFIHHILDVAPQKVSQLNFEGFKSIQEDTPNNPCPLCGGKLVERNKIVGCKNYPNCRFSLFKTFLKVNLNLSKIDSLLQGEIISLQGCQSKKGKKFGCRIRLNDSYKYEIVEYLNK